MWKQFLQDCADTKCELSEKVEVIIPSHHSDHWNRRLYWQQRYLHYCSLYHLHDDKFKTIANIDHLERNYQ